MARLCRRRPTMFRNIVGSPVSISPPGIEWMAVPDSKPVLMTFEWFLSDQDEPVEFKREDSPCPPRTRDSLPSVLRVWPRPGAPGLNDNDDQSGPQDAVVQPEIAGNAGTDHLEPGAPETESIGAKVTTDFEPTDDVRIWIN